HCSIAALAHAGHGRAAEQRDVARREMLAERRHHRLIPAIHETELLALEPRTTRRIHARDDRPDERRARDAIVLAQLALEQRQPDAVERARSAERAKPVRDRNGLESPPV